MSTAAKPWKTWAAPGNVRKARNPAHRHPPHRIAAEHASNPALRTLPAPSEIPPLRYHMTWHPRLDDDPAQRWLRDRVRDVLAEPPPQSQSGRDAQDDEPADDRNAGDPPKRSRRTS